MDTSGNLETLVERVLERARQEASAIVDRGAKAAEREIHRAREESAARKDAAETALREAAERRIHAARAETEQARRRAVMNARQAAVESVFEEALRSLAHPGTQDERRQLLQGLVREGIRAVGAPAVRVRLNATDREVASAPDFPKEIDGVAITVDETAIDTVGGPVVTDESGRVVFENTFEARLDRMREPLRRRVADTLRLAEEEERAR